MPSSSTPPVPPFHWNAKAARFTDATGRFVPTPTVQAAVETVIGASRDRIAALAGRLEAGRLTLAEWQTAMQTELKSLHLAQAAVAAGGWPQLGPMDFGSVGHTLRDQYRYLAGFAAAIADGTQPLAGVAARAALYADAAWATYQQGTRRAASRAGQQQELNILGDSQHCATCAAQTARGWVTIGTLIPIGQRECQVHCRCSLNFR